MSSIQINNVTKKFGDFTAVDDLSLDIADGEFVALLGPSGCGKTTTMNMIAGLETPTEGEILFAGQDLSGVPLQKRDIGFVFQNYAIFTHLSVYKNLAFGLEVKKLPKSDIERRVRTMAVRMNLEHRLELPASQLSVNEMQKLAIGRSAVAEPRIFLLDEPLSSVDANFRAYMRAELKVLQKEFGQTMIYVTHDQIEAMSLADKIAVISNGRLMQYGSPLEVYSSPENRFVANFVGSPRMNLIDGVLQFVGGRNALVSEGGAVIELAGRLNKSAEHSKNEKVSIGIRPQDIYFGPQTGASDVSLEGVVEEVERIGPTRLAYIRVNGTKFLAVDDQAERTPGETIGFNISTEKCLAFDLQSGERI